MLCVGIGLSLDCLSANTGFLFPHGMKKAHAGSAKRNSGATQPYYKPDRSRRKPAGKARNPKPEPEFRIMGLLRFSNFLRFSVSGFGVSLVLVHPPQHPSSVPLWGLRPAASSDWLRGRASYGGRGCWNLVLSILRGVRTDLGRREVWAVSRIKFCDTAKPALLSAANVRQEICEIRAIRGQILFGFRISFGFRFQDWGFLWCLDVGAWCFQFCAAFELTLVVGKSGRSAE